MLDIMCDKWNSRPQIVPPEFTLNINYRAKKMTDKIRCKGKMKTFQIIIRMINDFNLQTLGCKHLYKIYSSFYICNFTNFQPNQTLKRRL